MRDRNPIPKDIELICEMFEIERGDYQARPPNDDIWSLTTPPITRQGPVTLYTVRDRSLTVKGFEKKCLTDTARDLIRISATDYFPQSFDYYGGFEDEIDPRNPATYFRGCPEGLGGRSLELYAGAAKYPYYNSWPLIYLMAPHIAFAFTDNPDLGNKRNLEIMFGLKYKRLRLDPQDREEKDIYQRFNKEMGGPVTYYEMTSPRRFPKNWMRSDFLGIEGFLNFRLQR